VLFTLFPFDERFLD